MLKLQCPKCGNKMLYQGRNLPLENKRKRCVYCGFSFAIEKAVSAK